MNMIRRIVIFGLALALWIEGNHWITVATAADDIVTVDVCVYGGTPGGVMAAVEAARHGYRVAFGDQLRES